MLIKKNKQKQTSKRCNVTKTLSREKTRAYGNFQKCLQLYVVKFVWDFPRVTWWKGIPDLPVRGRSSRFIANQPPVVNNTKQMTQ